MRSWRAVTVGGVGLIAACAARAPDASTDAKAATSDEASGQVASALSGAPGNLGILVKSGGSSRYEWNDPVGDHRTDGTGLASSNAAADIHAVVISGTSTGLQVRVQLGGDPSSERVQVQVALKWDFGRGASAGYLPGFSDTQVADAAKWNATLVSRFADAAFVKPDYSLDPAAGVAQTRSAGEVVLTVPWAAIGGAPSAVEVSKKLRFTVATFAEQSGTTDVVNLGDSTVANALDVVSDYGAPGGAPGDGGARTYTNTWDGEFAGGGTPETRLDHYFDVWFGPSGAVGAPVVISRVGWPPSAAGAPFFALRNIVGEALDDYRVGDAVLPGASGAMLRVATAVSAVPRASRPSPPMPALSPRRSTGPRRRPRGEARRRQTPGRLRRSSPTPRGLRAPRSRCRQAAARSRSWIRATRSWTSSPTAPRPSSPARRCPRRRSPVRRSSSARGASRMGSPCSSRTPATAPPISSKRGRSAAICGSPGAPRRTRSGKTRAAPSTPAPTARWDRRSTAARSTGAGRSTAARSTAAARSTPARSTGAGRSTAVPSTGARRSTEEARSIRATPPRLMGRWSRPTRGQRATRAPDRQTRASATRRRGPAMPGRRMRGGWRTRAPCHAMPGRWRTRAPRRAMPGRRRTRAPRRVTRALRPTRASRRATQG